MAKKLTLAQQKLLVCIRDKTQPEMYLRRVLEWLWDHSYIFTLSGSDKPNSDEFQLTEAGQKMLDDLSPAKRESDKAVKAIVELAKLIDSDDQHIANDARAYMLGLAKCLNYELDGRKIAVVHATKY